MDNYYNILQVDITSSNLYIKSSYDNKIKQYYNKIVLSQDDINYIKLLKTSLYILTSNELKIKYNKLLFNSNKNINENENSNKNINENINENELLNNISLLNENYENNNINDIFNIDNKWMDNISINNEGDKKLNNNIINDRIFTLHTHNNKYEDNFLKPKSCRDYKKE